MKFEDESGNEHEASDEQEQALKKIASNLNQVNDLIRECKKLAQNANVPFSINVGGVHNTYEPDEDRSISGFAGWQNSSC